MTRTQIQLPDRVYARLKVLAERQEWSLAEAIRRATEEFLDRYPQAEKTCVDWKLPEPVDMGTYPVTPAQIKEMAQMSSTEEEVLCAQGVEPFKKL